MSTADIEERKARLIAAGHKIVYVATEDCVLQHLRMGYFEYWWDQPQKLVAGEILTIAPPDQS